MSREESEGRESARGDPGALAIALGSHDPAMAKVVRHYLQEQAALAEIQTEELKEEKKLHHWSMRVRHISDVMRLSFELALAVLVTVIAVFAGAAVWNAAEDHDLIVEAFSVPPDMAQTGMTGSVLAGRVLDKFGAMQAGTRATTQGSESYRGSDNQEVRVEIPETGISIGELDRMLRGWLGHETHVTGDLVRTAKGYGLTIRYGAKPGVVAEGDDLDKLAEQSAERLFAAARPLRYAEYLSQNKRYDEAEAIIVPLTKKGSAKDRAMAYADWAEVAAYRRNYYDMLEKSRQAVHLDPENPTAAGWLQGAEGSLGHDEAAHKVAVADQTLWHGAEIANLDPGLVAGGPLAFTVDAAELEGDYRTAVEAEAKIIEIGSMWDPTGEYAEDLALDHDIAGARAEAALIAPKESDGRVSANPAEAQFFIAVALGDWQGAVAAGKREDAVLALQPASQHYRKVIFWPQFAAALAHNGSVAEAESLMVQSPLDCDACGRARGAIAAARHDWAAAARWFALVSARSPSIPFADSDWGEMLLAAGDLDGAIAKFKAANEKGAHFADPLEMWGEALILKNRSDLALAKFAEADKYAPHWGRLHLKWGEALFWLNRKDEARNQFAIAAKLDLTAAEKSELARMRAAHG